MATAQVILQLQSQVQPQIRATADAYKQLSAEEQKAELAAIRYATAVQRVNAASSAAATSAQKLATEEQRTASATAQAAAASSRAELAAFRLSQAKDKAASSSGGLSSAIGGLKGALGGLGIAFGVQQVAQFGIAAAQSALSLRETQNSLRAVAGSAKNYQEVLATARQQQVLFGGTLEENIQGLSGLTITARQSGANLQQLIDISQRLGTLDPAQGVAGARIALSEALSGDPTSLAKRYEIPRAALAKLRDESTSSGDKLKIIDQYLNKVGITSAAVAGKVDQTALAYRTLGAEVDNAKNALGGFLADGLAPAATGLTRLLQGGEGLNTSLLGLAGSLREGGNATSYLARAFGISAESADYARGVLQQLGVINFNVADVADQARDKWYAEADALDAVARSAGNAAAALAGVQGAQASDVSRRHIGPSGTGLRGSVAGGAFGGGAGETFGKAIGEAEQLHQAQLQFQLTSARTGAQRIALLQKELARTHDQAERLRLMTQIEQERQSIAREAEQNGKRHTSELNKQLSLEERIRDSKEKQLKATLDAQEAIIRDRQEKRKEDREIAAAQRILSSGRASSEFKAAAADRLALIGINRQQRALAISGQLATAGGQIVNGRVMQSLPGGGAVGGAPVLPGAVPGAPAVGPGMAGAEERTLVQVFLDSEQISARVVTSLAQGRRQANSAGGGQAGV